MWNLILYGTFKSETIWNYFFLKKTQGTWDTAIKMVSHKGQAKWKWVVKGFLGAHGDRKSLSLHTFESRLIVEPTVWKPLGLCGAAWWVMKSSRRKKQNKPVKWTRPWRDVRRVQNVLSQRKKAKEGLACSSCGEPASFISCCSEMALEQLQWWRTVKTALEIKYKIWKGFQVKRKKKKKENTCS